MIDVVSLELLEDLAHLNTEINNLVLAEFLIVELVREGNAAVGDNIELQLLFVGVVLNTYVYVISDIAEGSYRIDKAGFVLDKIDIFLVIQLVREFIVGEFSVYAVIVFVDKTVNFAFIGVRNKSENLPIAQCCGQFDFSHVTNSFSYVFFFIRIKY